MNLAGLQEKLIGTARKNPPDNRVPYAFEKRIMARLGQVPKVDPWSSLARVLWCGAAACIAIAIATSVWTFEPTSDSDGALAFSQGVEQSILSPVNDEEALW